MITSSINLPTEVFQVCYLIGSIAGALVLIRFIKGPTVFDRVLCLDLIAAIVMCMSIIFAIESGRSVFIDVALSIAIIAFLGTVSFARFLGINKENKLE